MDTNFDIAQIAVPPFEGSAAELDTFALLNPDIADTARTLHEQGYAIIEPGFSDETLSAAAALTSKIPKDEGRLQDGWLFNKAVRALATDALVLDLLERLYARSVVPFQTLNFKYGTEQGTHSDTFHFNSVPARFMCGVWIALEDISEDAGPLYYYPGSHRLPVLAKTDLPGAQTYAAYEDFVEELMDRRGVQRERALLKRGQAFIWSANLFHGGSARRVNQATRLSQVSHYFFGDCAYFTPVASDPARNAFWIREPYDIRHGHFVSSNRAYLPGRRRWKPYIARQLEVFLKRKLPL